MQEKMLSKTAIIRSSLPQSFEIFGGAREILVLTVSKWDSDSKHIFQYVNSTHEGYYHSNTRTNEVLFTWNIVILWFTN